MEYLKELSPEDKAELLRAPVVFAVMAAVSDDGMVNSAERTEAIKLSHLRTYTSPAFLQNFYRQVDEIFEEEFDKLTKALPEDAKSQREFLKEKLAGIRKIMNKLDRDYAIHLTQSLKSFSRHVFRANSHYLEYFLLPVIMNELEKNF